jgi:hypothetical protein
MHPDHTEIHGIQKSPPVRKSGNLAFLCSSILSNRETDDGVTIRDWNQNYFGERLPNVRWRFVIKKR